MKGPQYPFNMGDLSDQEYADWLKDNPAPKQEYHDEPTGFIIIFGLAILLIMFILFINADPNVVCALDWTCQG